MVNCILYSLTKSNVKSAPDLEWSNPVVDKPQLHQHFPKSQDIQYPICCSCRSLLGLHLECDLLLVATDQLHRKLIGTKKEAHHGQVTVLTKEHVSQ